MTMRPYCPRDFASYCVDYFSRGLTFRFGGGLWRVWTPRGGTKGFPSPDEHPPPSPPVRQGDSASLPSLFHLATSKIPSAPQGAVYLDVFGTSCDLDYGSLVYPNVWHNWGCLFFIFCSVRGLSSALCRFPLLTLIRHSGSGFGQIHAPYRLHHRLSILSSHPPTIFLKPLLWSFPYSCFQKLGVFQSHHQTNPWPNRSFSIISGLLFICRCYPDTMICISGTSRIRYTERYIAFKPELLLSS